ncbi:MAG TPA: hypothetical protein VF618_04335 [Thermoanaerobaculia bacterium]
MKRETADVLIRRIQAMEAEVNVLRSTVDGETLAANQQQYLARCFDLLHMELTAVRSYIDALR